MLGLRQIASALGGHVEGSVVRAPGPGHGKLDDSLLVKIKYDGSIFVHSFSGDDWKVCRDFVMNRLGIPWKPD